jgi:hypothetical protein
MGSGGARAVGVVAFLAALGAVVGCGSPIRRVNDRDPSGPLPLSSLKATFPISFECKARQFRPEAGCIFRGPGYDLFLTAAEAAFGFRTDSSSEPIRLRIAGVNPDVEVEGRKPLPSYSNYLIGNDPRKWRKHVPQYGEVWYSDLYPGIDLVYYGSNGQLEYDFVVAPHANANRIGLSIAGWPRRLHIRQNTDGDLVIPIDGGEVLLRRPRLYQGNSCLHAESREHGPPLASCVEIKGCRFKLYARKNIESQVRFELPPYDHSQPLIIDPVVSFSTFLGGNVTDSANGMAVDSSGDIYLVGTTNSTIFPLTSDPIQNTLAGDTDAFVTKISGDGSSLIYSTYLGGSNAEFAHGIAVDSSGSAYVTGETYSSDFPLVNQYQSQNPSGSGFVSKLSPDGSTLIYSTYLGGSTEGTTNGIAVDSNGDAVVAGRTYAVDFPVVNAFQPSHAADNGSEDAFVTKFSADGSSLIFSTYLGGNSNDMGQGIAPDPVGNIYVGGITSSSNFPTTPGAYQTTYDAAGLESSFVSKFSPSGALVYSTYLAASQTFAIAASSAGNAVVTGTADDEFPVTPGAFQTVPGLDSDAFVTEFDSTGSSLAYSTFLGGNDIDNGNAIAIDSAGNAYVTGETSSLNFPLSNPTQSTIYPGVPAAFVSELNSAGSQLVFSTYLGGGSIGSGSQQGNAIAVDSSGSIYVAGSTNLPDFPVVNAIQPILNGAENAFVTKYVNDFALQGSPATATVSAGQTATYSITVATAMGFSQTVSFSCSGAPQNSTCTVSPMSVTLGGTNNGSATLTVATKASSAMLVTPFGNFVGRPSTTGDLTAAGIGLRAMSAVLALCIVAWLASSRAKKATVGFLSVLLIASALVACGGGGGGGGAGTQPGTYTITVTAATVSGISRDADFKLIVN